MWVKYFELDQAKLKDMYYRGQSWGELITYLWVSDSQYLYGVGWFQSGPSQPKWGAPIPVTYGIGDRKCRIDVDALGMFGIDSTGVSYVAVLALKGGNPVMPYIYSIGIGVRSPPDRNIGIPFKISVVVEGGNRMSIYIDSEKVADIALSDNADTIKIGVFTEDVNGNVGCMFTYISASYYDIFAGVVQQITSLLPTIMYLLVGVMFISLIVRAFRPKRKTEEKEKEKEKR